MLPRCAICASVVVACLWDGTAFAQDYAAVGSGLHADAEPQHRWAELHATAMPDVGLLYGRHFGTAGPAPWQLGERPMFAWSRPIPVPVRVSADTTVPATPRAPARRPAGAPRKAQARPATSPGKTSGSRKGRRYQDGVYLLKRDYYLSYPRNVWRFFSAPARFDTTDWLIAAGVAGTTGILLALDGEIRDFWQDNITGDTSDSAFDFFGFFGSTKKMIALSAGVYALSELVDVTGAANLKREKAAGLLAIESIIIAQGFTTGLKYVTGRERPNKTDDRFNFKGPGNGTNQAFPSGHATVAFAFATTIAEMYKEKYGFVPWIMYPLAAGAALSRVDRDKHWASDVFLGSVVGYAVAKTVTLYNPFLQAHDMEIRHLGSVDGPGLVLVRTF